MGRKSTFSEAQEASLRALRDDHPDETYVKVASRALGYGMVEGKTVEQIADKLSRMYLPKINAERAEQFKEQLEETQLQLTVADPRAEALDRIADTLSAIYSLIKENHKETNA